MRAVPTLNTVDLGVVTNDYVVKSKDLSTTINGVINFHVCENGYLTLTCKWDDSLEKETHEKIYVRDSLWQMVFSKGTWNSISIVTPEESK